MKTFGDIKDRVIFVDFITATHGHFLTTVLNELVYSYREDIEYKNNYHGAKMSFSLILDCTDLLKHDLDSIKLGTSVPNGNLPIFWPMHYGGCNGGTEDYANRRTIEIYVGATNKIRHAYNRWFNTTGTPRAAMENNDYFRKNFYQLATGAGFDQRINEDMIPKGITNSKDYNFTKEDIIDFFCNYFLSAHSFNQPWRSDLEITSGKNLPFEFTSFYNFDIFLKFIYNVKSFFELDFIVDEDYIKRSWTKFISIQRPIKTQGSDLHLIDLGYIKFVETCQQK